MYPHRIRLRGPWECQSLGDGSTRAAASSRRFRRRFGYPGRIDAHERVWLTFAGVAGTAEVRLNDHVLGHHEGPAAFEFEVISLLRPRNELVVVVQGAAEQSGWRGEAALEIRCTAFLRELRCTATQHGERVELRVGGAVVGEAERPLELYVVVDRSTAAYQVVTPADEGQPFEILVPDLPVELWRQVEGGAMGPMVKVDLVNGAVVWYTSEAEVRLEKF
jgi:hypothetical protein